MTKLLVTELDPKVAGPMDLVHVGHDRVFLYPLSPDCPDVVNAVIST
jgi:hypothetical protein